MNDTMGETGGGRVAVAAMVVGAGVFTLADLIRRAIIPGDASTAGGAAHVASHSGWWLVAGLLALAAPFLMLPGIVLAARAVAARGAALTRIGAVMLCLGLLAAIGHAVAFYGMEALYVRAPLADADMTRFDDASNSYPLFFLLIVVFIIGMALGPILLTLGLRRARIVPIWVPVMAIVFAVTGTVGGLAAGVVGVLASVATFVAVGRARGRGAAPADGAAVILPSTT